MNVTDSQTISSILNSAGFLLTKQIDDADIIFFNTCSVREHAEARALGRITNEMARKKDNPKLIICVVGCMAQRLKSDLLLTGVDYVFGVDEYSSIPKHIKNHNKTKTGVFTKINSNKTYGDILPNRDNPFSAFVSITRGCNNFCSYCIVPYVRGKERSRSTDGILKEIKVVANSGCKEVILLGQNVNSYLFNGTDFASLLDKVEKIDKIERIRFITSHPKDLSDRVIEAMRDNKKVCENIHLPLQSGDNKILKLMRRDYTVEHYLNLISKLRKSIPNISITTDIIVGFPQESKKQFENTVKVIEKIGFNAAFLFKYSKRSGTAAALMDSQISESTKLKRLQKIINIQNKITTKKYAEQLGKTKEVYVDGFSKKSNKYLSGKTRDFKIAVFLGNKNLLGKMVNIKITETSGWTLKGELI